MVNLHVIPLSGSKPYPEPYIKSGIIDKIRLIPGNYSPQVRASAEHFGLVGILRKLGQCRCACLASASINFNPELSHIFFWISSSFNADFYSIYSSICRNVKAEVVVILFIVLIYAYRMVVITAVSISRVSPFIGH